MQKIKLSLVPLALTAAILSSGCKNTTNYLYVTKTKGVLEGSISQNDDNILTDLNIYSVETFSLDLIPSYSGEPYTEVNGNVPFFTEEDYQTESFESYSDLDTLNRCGTAYANIGKDLMPAEERGKIGQIRPSGWQLIKYDIVDGKYLYNRCHLIGYQLTAENANEKNLITGTRYLNVQGMLPFENMVADYIKETDNHVLYKVTPIFDGDNLVASGVLMEAESVEDGGTGISYNVFVYNVQPGVKIDYRTGESWISEETDYKKIQNTESSITIGYVLNINSNKFHMSDCSSVGKIKEGNKEEYSGSRDSIVANGYLPCGSCNP